MTAMRRRGTRWCAVTMALLLVSCAARKPGDPIRPGYNMYSKEQDIEIGREASAEVRQQVEVVNDDQLQAYVREVGQRLGARPEADGYPYSFTLINDPSINAFALPGGPIFVHSGLIQAAENEGHLAGVLAHEISHVALRHGTNQASKASLAQLPAVLAGAAIGDQGILGQLGQIGLGLGLNVLLMKYSRTAENQADALGTRIMAGAGYNPLDMAHFFEKLEAQGGPSAPEFLSSHPNPGNRVRSVTAEIGTLPPGTYNTGTGQFSQMRARVERLPPPRERPQTAQAIEPQTAANGFRRLDAGTWSVEYPANWRTFGGGGSPVVTIAPEGGLVQDNSGRVHIGYGAVFSTYRPQNARNFREATEELLNDLSQADRSLQLVGGLQQVDVAGARGHLVQLRGASPFGGQEREIVVTLPHTGGIFYAVFVAPAADFQRVGDIYEHMFRSIQLAR